MHFPFSIVALPDLTQLFLIIAVLFIDSEYAQPDTLHSLGPSFLVVSLTYIPLVIEGVLLTAAQIEPTEHHSMQLFYLEPTFKVKHVLSVALQGL